MSQYPTTGPMDAETAGALREQLREAGWRSDLAWALVGVGHAGTVQGEARRTIAYLPSLRAVDGGASKVWQDGDVPAPAVADAREVFVTRPDDTEWHSESLEAPARTIAATPEPPETSRVALAPQKARKAGRAVG